MSGLWLGIEPLTVYSTYQRLTNQTIMISGVWLKLTVSLQSHTVYRMEYPPTPFLYTAHHQPQHLGTAALSTLLLITFVLIIFISTPEPLDYTIFPHFLRLFLSCILLAIRTKWFAYSTLMWVLYWKVADSVLIHVVLLQLSQIQYYPIYTNSNTTSNITTELNSNTTSNITTEPNYNVFNTLIITLYLTSLQNIFVIFSIH